MDLEMLVEAVHKLFQKGQKIRRHIKGVRLSRVLKLTAHKDDPAY
jgi:hypothetical protein